MLTKCQEKALKAMKKGYNVHLFGEGGTGKSFVINEFLNSLTESERDKTIITAPTGIAALNVNGVTIHRAFKVPIGPIGPHNDPPPKVSETLKVAKRVIIDEISMCRFDVFEYVTKCIRLAEKTYKRKIQVIVIGDMLQLQPVLIDKDRAILTQMWGEEKISGFAFEAPLWKSYKFKNCYLDEVMRQKGDAELIENDNKARRGDKTCIEWFNSLENKPSKNAIHLCARKKEADEINGEATKKFENVTKYKSRISGSVTGADKPAPDELELAKGMKVMVLSNGEHYKNGQIGEVVSCFEDNVHVEIDGNICVIKACEWLVEDYVVKGEPPKLEKEEIGSFIQIPLKPAYAITIHKSQGQTYDSVVIHPDCFAAGQLYVAISRCTNRKGLSFSSKIKEEQLITDKDCLDFYEKIENESNSSPEKKEKVTKSKPPKETRGGVRVGAGRKAKYGKGLEMKTIKIPVVAEDAVREFLSAINWEEFKNNKDAAEKSKVKVRELTEEEKVTYRVYDDEEE